MACLSVGRLAWFLFHSNTKGADQPAQMRRLICAFVVRSIERIAFKLASCTISLSWLGGNMAKHARDKDGQFPLKMCSIVTLHIAFKVRKKANIRN